ncbi:MAG: F0F1 ATP synthase subunit A, partial [Planctomycetes bacterium]|nr:F0F1 ATP synthase subunit A [Planctomycetota bacterium]
MNPLAEQGAAGAEQAAHAAGSDPGTVFLHLFQHVQAHPIFRFSSADGANIFVITNHTILQILACAIAFMIFYYVARRGVQGERPRGVFCNAFESVVLYVRDEMVSKFMTKDHAEKLLPLFLTFFIFILFTNLIGLFPIPGLAGTATANIAVTCALATITFGVMIGGGMMIVGPGKFWTSLVPHGIPAFVIPLMFVIEVAGLLIKAFALMMRLFANMVAGHLVILSFFGLVVLFQSYAVMVPAVLMAVFITLLEVLVAFIQA